MTLPTINNDSLFSILQFLTPEEALSLRSCSRRMRNEASTNKIWKIYCSRQSLLLEDSSIRDLQTNYFIKYYFSKFENPSLDGLIGRYRFLALQGFGFTLSIIPSIVGTRISSPVSGVLAEGVSSALVILPFSSASSSRQERMLIPFISGGVGIASGIIHRYFNIAPDLDAAFPALAALTVSTIFTERLMHLSNRRLPDLAARLCSTTIALYPYCKDLWHLAAIMVAIRVIHSFQKEYQRPGIFALAIASEGLKLQTLALVSSCLSGFSIVDCLKGYNDARNQFSLSLSFSFFAYSGWKIYAGILPTVRCYLSEVASHSREADKRYEYIVKRVLLSPIVLQTRWNLWRGCIQLRGRVVRAVREDIPNAILGIPRAILSEVTGNIRLFRNIASYLINYG